MGTATTIFQRVNGKRGMMGLNVHKEINLPAVVSFFGGCEYRIVEGIPCSDIYWTAWASNKGMNLTATETFMRTRNWCAASTIIATSSQKRMRSRKIFTARSI